MMTAQSGQIHICWTFCFSIIVLGCYVHRPLPDGLSNPWKVRLITTMFKAVDDLSSLGDRLGVASKLNIMRLLTNAISKLLIPDSTGIKVTDTDFGGVKVRIYDPIEKQPNASAIMFFHGGGWVFCDVDVYDHMPRGLAQRLNVMVVSVEYRLAPENPYPAPLDDCFQSTMYLFKHAQQYGIDPHRIAVMGDSAGGNLAAAVSLRFKTLGLPDRPKLQLLIYPSLQGFDFTLPSYVENEDKVYGSRHTLATFLLQYMGQDPALADSLIINNHTSRELKQTYSSIMDIALLPPEFRTNHIPLGVDDGNEELERKLNAVLLDPFFAPLMANDKQLEGLPQTYVMTTQFDLLRDEGILFTQRLKKVGNDVTWMHYNDTFHGAWGFFNPPLQLDAGLRSMNDIVEYIKLNL